MKLVMKGNSYFIQANPTMTDVALVKEVTAVMVNEYGYCDSGCGCDDELEFYNLLTNKFSLQADVREDYATAKQLVAERNAKAELEELEAEQDAECDAYIAECEAQATDKPMSVALNTILSAIGVGSFCFVPTVNAEPVIFEEPVASVAPTNDKLKYQQFDCVTPIISASWTGIYGRVVGTTLIDNDFGSFNSSGTAAQAYIVRFPRSYPTPRYSARVTWLELNTVKVSDQLCSKDMN